MNKQQIKEQIEALQKQLEELERSERENDFCFEPKQDETYYCVGEHGGIYDTWNNSSEHDNLRIKQGRVFKIKEIAKEFSEYERAVQLIKKYIKDNGLWFKPDWNGESYVGIQYVSRKYNWFFVGYQMVRGVLPVFKSKEHAQQVIDNCLPQLEIIRKWDERNI